MMAWLIGLPTVSPAELHRIVEGGGAHVFDVNAPSSWLSAGLPVESA